MRSYHFIKYLIGLELIMNDEKQKLVSDITKIESQLSKKIKRTTPPNKYSNPLSQT